MKYRAPLLCILLAAAAAWLAAVPGALAQVVPEMFNYQGRLVDENGLVNGVRTMVFRLYNAQTGGDVVFIETQQVTVVDGLYSVQVGDNPDYGSLRDALTNAELWLEVAIGTNTLSPRERVISVMYALMADRVTTGATTTAMLADGAVTTAKLDDGAVSSDKILDGTVQDADLAANSVDGSKVIDGSLTAADVDPATFSNTFWKLDGNAGTDESTHYL
ncbi:MAG TPA: hypothetical protein ENG36_03755, partial [Lentisphaerae bacterium]|nr:hypothetical protein [Lentisphaerota bacterium]